MENQTLHYLFSDDTVICLKHINSQLKGMAFPDAHRQC